MVKHKENCLIINGEQRVKLSQGIIKCLNYFKQLPAPFKVYADFECIVKETGLSEEITDENISYTKKYQDHIPCGFADKVVCIDDRFTKDIVIYRGKDCVNKFISMMLEEHECCSNVMKKHNLIMSEEEEELFQSSNKCWICNKLFVLVDEKVRDHCHISRKFRGAVHFSCNANLKIFKKVPVIFHNLKGYNGHLIMKEINNFDVIIDVIPNGLEKYMPFIINRNLVFIDSMQFMNSSLDSLVKNLVDKDFKYLSKEFKEFKDKDLKLLKEKGVYPYEYMNSLKKFNETELPSKDKFFSSLKNEDISEKDYEKAKDIWNTFNIKNLGEYHNLYLKADVLLLCDIFEKFINTCLNYYGLDPCHCFSSPGLACDAMLKMTGIELELISDIDMYLFIEKGMRGGISYIAQRYSKANNKYMKDYDNTEEITYIMYFDANNLYGSAMTEYFPYSGFEWMTEEEINNFDLSSIRKDNSEGYILEVDLEYPSELHDYFDDYPPAPEKLKVTNDMLSKYCSDIANKHGIRVGEVNKLIPNLGNKKNYVIHYRNLQLYISLGIKVTKFHRILKFKQSDWMKTY